MKSYLVIPICGIQHLLNVLESQALLVLTDQETN